MTKILVVGVGAIGSLYASRLSKVGVEVTLVCRSEFEKVKKDGIEIESIWGDFLFKPQRVIKDVSEYQEQADFIIVATKVLPSLNLPKLIAPSVSEKSTIVLIQNGIFIEDEIARAFPKNQILSTIAFVDVIRIGQGKIKHSGDGRLTFGEFLNANPVKTKILLDLLDKGGVPVQVSENIQHDRWKKLLWNASFNPISVVGGDLDTKQILDNPNLKRLIRDVMLEVKGLAKLQNCEISEELIDSLIASTQQRKTPAITSMLLDFRNKREMEIEAILGNAIRFAENKNHKVPLLKGIYDEIKKLR